MPAYKNKMNGAHKPEPHSHKQKGGGRTMPINGVLTIYHSRRDMYGNVYYAVSLANDRFDVVARGTIAADNVNTRECREQLGWHIERVEMPIRDYNRMVKKWPHYGCQWDEIKSNLVKG